MSHMVLELRVDAPKRFQKSVERRMEKAVLQRQKMWRVFHLKTKNAKKIG